jgi:hypothetical protein
MYEVIDNFLPEQELKSIQDVILGADFPWFFVNAIANLGEVVENYYFTHIFYRRTINSDHYNILNPILERLNVKALIRAKANLFPNINKYIVDNKHVDHTFEHKGAMFYLNTNNGGTILEDGTKIDSVENRILIFDSSKPHSSTNCTDAKRRVNINFNYF